jgi:D-alanine-D-alanine ligase-like ATP-grasp enzyme
MMDMAARARRWLHGHGADDAHRLLGCKGAARAPTSAGTTSRAAQEGLYLLEVNTQPGMTPLSLCAEQAKRYRGISSYGRAGRARTSSSSR